MQKSKNARKAISPILATVILIAITLIAAIAVAGFAFGLFGNFTNSAQVSAQVVSCTTVTPATCTVNLTNTGTSNTVATGCSISLAGKNVVGILAVVSGSSTTLTAGGVAQQLTCTGPAASVGGAVGSQAVGSITLSNGASVPYTATWS